MKLKKFFSYGILTLTLTFLMLSALISSISSVYAEGNIICTANDDCVSGFIGKEYCYNNNVYKDFSNSSCLNPGTDTSYCDTSIIQTLLSECGEDSWDAWGDNYCKEGNVYHSRIGLKKGCKVINIMGNISGCYSELALDEILVQSCSNGCENGVCISILPEICNSNSDCNIDEFCEFDNGVCYAPGVCVKVSEICPMYFDPVCGCDGKTYSNDCARKMNKVSKFHDGECVIQNINCTCNSDCGADGYIGDNICIGKDVYRDYQSYSCSNPGTSSSHCSSSVQGLLIQSCSDECLNGACIDNPDVINCSRNSDCGTDGFIGEEYCDDNNVYQDYKEYQCVNPGSENSLCISTIIDNLIDECKDDCEDGKCKSKNHNGPYIYPEEERAVEYIYEPGENFSFFGLNQTIEEVSPAKLKTEGVILLEQILGNTALLILLVLIAMLIILIIVLGLMR